jgi:hypothetical protein
MPLGLARAHKRGATNQSLLSVRPRAVLSVRWGRLACAVRRPDRGTVNDLTSCNVVEGVSHARAAKSAIPPILSTLLPAREDAINGSGVAYDAPRVVYVCLGLSSSKCCQRRAQGQSGNQRLPHARLHLFEGNTCKRSGPASEVRSADVAFMACT